jgi:hypothetical protein
MVYVYATNMGGEYKRNFKWGVDEARRNQLVTPTNPRHKDRPGS